MYELHQFLILTVLMIIYLEILVIYTLKDNPITLFALYISEATVKKKKWKLPTLSYSS